MREIQRQYDDGLQGWQLDRTALDRFLAGRHQAEFAVAGRYVRATFDERTTCLSAFLTRTWPTWQRGAQAIGSCVGWGLELALTALSCKAWLKSGYQGPKAEVSTEACYGGSRCEGQARKYAGYVDGSQGWAAAQFAVDYGAVYRLNYAALTSVPEHDLRTYSGKKEKDWGAWGCGGRDDKDRLDALAKDHPAKIASRVRSFDEVAAAVAGSVCPVTIASNYGCSMRRDNLGQCYWSKRWSHQMCILDVRFGAHPAARIFQSWGPDVASGPSGDDATPDLATWFPGGTPPAILGTSWWAPVKDVDRICESGDCWAIGDVDGWDVDRFDWRAHMWGGVVR
jgi:hypothetical protein